MEQQTSRADKEKVEVKNPIEVVFDDDVPLSSEQKELVVDTISSFIENYALA
jgi:hypothetical protein